MRQRLHTAEDTDEQIHKVKSERVLAQELLSSWDLGCVALPVHECVQQPGCSLTPILWVSTEASLYLIKSLALPWWLSGKELAISN